MSDYLNNVRCFQNDEINTLYWTKFSNLMLIQLYLLDCVVLYQ